MAKEVLNLGDLDWGQILIAVNAIIEGGQFWNRNGEDFLINAGLVFHQQNTDRLDPQHASWNQRATAHA